MISYNMHKSEIDNIKWPENIYFGSKKYYLMNKKNDLINIKVNILNFYCVNHHYYSHIVKNNKICNSKIQYNKSEDVFYLLEDHSVECQKNNPPKKNELLDNSKKVYKLSNLKKN